MSSHLTSFPIVISFASKCSRYYDVSDILRAGNMSKGGSTPPEKGRSMVLEEGRCRMRLGSGGRFFTIFSMN